MELGVACIVHARRLGAAGAASGHDLGTQLRRGSAPKTSVTLYGGTRRVTFGTAAPRPLRVTSSARAPGLPAPYTKDLFILFYFHKGADSRHANGCNYESGFFHRKLRTNL